MHANKVRSHVLKALHEQINAGIIDRLPSMTVSKTNERQRVNGRIWPERFRVSLEREMYSTDAYDVDTMRLRDAVVSAVREAHDHRIELQVVQPV